MASPGRGLRVSTRIAADAPSAIRFLKALSLCVRRGNFGHPLADRPVRWRRPLGRPVQSRAAAGDRPAACLRPLASGPAARPCLVAHRGGGQAEPTSRPRHGQRDDDHRPRSTRGRRGSARPSIRRRYLGCLGGRRARVAATPARRLGRPIRRYSGQPGLAALRGRTRRRAGDVSTGAARVSLGRTHADRRVSELPLGHSDDRDDGVLPPEDLRSAAGRTSPRLRRRSTGAEAARPGCRRCIRRSGARAGAPGVAPTRARRPRGTRGTAAGSTDERSRDRWWIAGRGDHRRAGRGAGVLVGSAWPPATVSNQTRPGCRPRPPRRRRTSGRLSPAAARGLTAANGPPQPNGDPAARWPKSSSPHTPRDSAFRNRIRQVHLPQFGVERGALDPAMPFVRDWGDVQDGPIVGKRAPCELAGLRRERELTQDLVAPDGWSLSNHRIRTAPRHLGERPAQPAGLLRVHDPHRRQLLELARGAKRRCGGTVRPLLAAQ